MKTVFNWGSTNVQRMFNWSATGLQLVYATDVLSVCYQCATSVQLSCNHRATSVHSSCNHRASSVQPVCNQCPIHQSQLITSISTSISPSQQSSPRLGFRTVTVTMSLRTIHPRSTTALGIPSPFRSGGHIPRILSVRLRRPGVTYPSRRRKQIDHARLASGIGFLGGNTIRRPLNTTETGQLG